MSNRINEINAKLIAVIAAINGAGGYTNDLSATGRVFIAGGRPDGAPDLCVWIVQGAIEMTSAGIGGGPNSKDRWTATYAINGFAPATADTPYARLTAANLLYQDLHTALRGSRLLNDGSRNLVYESTLSEMVAMDGGDIGFAGVGVVSFVLTYMFEATNLS